MLTKTPKSFGLLFIAVFLLFGCNQESLTPSEDARSEVAAVLATSETVFDSGAFRIVEDTEGRLIRVDRAGKRMESAERMRKIFLVNRTLDISVKRPAPDFNALAGGPNIRLLHHRGPVSRDFVSGLKRAGLLILDYVPENAFIVYDSGRKINSAAVSVVEKIDYLADWGVSDKLHHKLQYKWGEQDVSVYLVNHDMAGDSRAIIEQRSKASYGAVTKLRNHLIFRVRLNQASIALLKSRSDVYWIEPYLRPELVDERQGMIMAGEHDNIKPTHPGYNSWLQNRGVLTNLDSVVVDITDSGCDRGTPESIGHPDLIGRVLYINNYTSEALGNDIDGHGTINTSIVGAMPPNPGSAGTLDTLGYLYGMGIAPGAKLAASRVFSASGWDIGGSSLTQILTASHEGGADISSNSWGAGVFGEYNSESQEYDGIIRDADRDPSNGLQPIAVFFAAGNDGDGGTWGSGETFESIGAPATAKNVITVGASENWRMTGTDGCGADDTDADNCNDLADFSSRGFCLDGRLKPEIVAPGTHIQGVASSDPNYMEAQGVCDFYWPEGQTLYAWSSGTSHSCPAAAGAGALYANWYKQHYEGKSPSPAMIKAMISTHADDMVGGDTGWGAEIPHIPNKWVGWGRINLADAFGDLAREIVDETELFTQTGQSFNMGNLRPFDPAKPVKIALAWTDAPGATTGNNYNNNLDLLVSVDGAVEYKGNVFENAISIPGGEFDEKNNLEMVFLPGASTGVFEISIIAANINSDGVPGNAFDTDQDFALYMFNVQSRLPCETDEQCNDDNPCTNEYCADDDLCTTTPKCDDDNVCTFNECNRSNGACSYPSISCEDENECTTDSCDPAAGCSYNSIGNCSDCDGGLCVSGQCVNCDDGNPCTADSCDPLEGCLNVVLDDCSSCGESGACIAGKCIGPGGGDVSENFEGGLPEGEEWSTGGSANWILFEGGADGSSYSAASGNIDHSQSSWIQLDVEIIDEGTLSFHHKESTESGYDKLKLYIDSELVEEWSGTSDWTAYSGPLTNGAHSIMWEYFKDISADSGQDRVWIDNVRVSGSGGDCDDEDVCTIEADSGEGCVYCPLSDGSFCDDGNECSQGSTCQAGSCLGFDLPDESPCTADENPCTQDWCISGNCSHPAAPDLTTCTEDGNLCTADVCLAGLCEHPAIADNDPCGGPGDSDECTLDLCQNGACTSTAHSDCTPCGEAGMDICVDGKCGGVATDINEGFEGGAIPADWVTGGEAPWSVTMSGPGSGTYAAQSGEIVHLESSWLEISVELSEDGTVSFLHKESSESSYDKLKFYVDGQLLADAVWSGSTAWSSYTTVLSVGPHLLRWAYEKDVTVDGYDDAVWIDNILITGIAGGCDDGDPCTGDAAMADQNCRFCPLPDLTPCDDGNECSESASCMAGSCIGQPLPDDTTCSEDDNECTFDKCVGGICAHPAIDNHNSCTEDNNNCTLDYCFAGNCEHPLIPDNEPCDLGGDDNDCTVDTCKTGVCQHQNFDDCTPCGEGDICIEGLCGGILNDLEEGFEDGVVPDGWTTGGDNIWSISDDGAASGLFGAVSGFIVDSQECWLQMELELVTDGTIRFLHRESSEGGYDKLRLFVDDNEFGSWSGLTDWHEFSADIAPGVHTIRWAYTKDSSASSYDDMVMIDDISISGLLSSCDDEDPCTLEGRNESECIYCALDDGLACDDGNFCSTASVCQSGSCAIAEERDCTEVIIFSDCEEALCNEDEDSCEANPINEGAPCDDEAFCTQSSFCNTGVCTPGEATDCSGVITQPDCQLPRCKEETDECYWIAANESVACNEDAFCSSGNHCLWGDCTAGEIRDCSEGISEPQCQQAGCDENSDSCIGDPINEGGSCNDQSFCTIQDKCSAGVCTGQDRDCSKVIDEAQCQQARCDESDDVCLADPANEGENCDDGLYCTVSTSCTNGACANAQPRDCSFALSEPQCQSPSCSESSDNCLALPTNEGQACDDGFYCTVDGACNDGVCTLNARDCVDEISCTIDSCNEVLERCVFTPDDDACDDQIACTDNNCSPAAGGCVFTPEDASCDDQIACTADTCSGDEGCLHDTDDSLCDDGYDWSADRCDAEMGCVHDESGSCDNPTVAALPFLKVDTLDGRPNHVDRYLGQCDIEVNLIGSDVIYEVTLEQYDSIMITVSQENFDAAILVLADCGDTMSCQVYAQDDWNDEEESLIFAADTTGQYYIVVENAGLDREGESEFTISIDYYEQTDGDAIDGDAPDGDMMDGDMPDGDLMDGDMSDGDILDGDLADGDTVDGDLTPADGDEDGTIPDGDESIEGEIPADGDDPNPVDGDESTGSGGGCQQGQESAAGLFMLLLVLGVVVRRRAAVGSF